MKARLDAWRQVGAPITILDVKHRPERVDAVWNDLPALLREVLAALTPSGGQPEPLEKALKLAKEATNGWACYAKRAIEHDEIARLHREIDALKGART